MEKKVKKIMISFENYYRLVQDMITFGFQNEDNSPKYNSFYTTLIINTYDYLEKKNVMESIISSLKQIIPKPEDSKDHISDNEYHRMLYDKAITIKNSIISDERNAKNEKAIFIQWTENSSTYLDQIIDSCDQLSDAVIFRHLINEYLLLPQFIRERILFAKQYESLLRVKNSKCKCIITTNSSSLDSHNKPVFHKHNFDLYEISAGKEEFHTYIVGYTTNDDGTRRIMSIKLSNIRSVAKKEMAIEIAQNELDDIKDKIKYGPAFLNGEYKTFKVKFTDNGKNLIGKFYKDRPYFDYNNTSDNLYSFYCTETQITNYLKQFGPDAILIEPKETRNKLIKFYKESYESYSKTE